MSRSKTSDPIRPSSKSYSRNADIEHSFSGDNGSTVDDSLLQARKKRKNKKKKASKVILIWPLCHLFHKAS